MVRDNIANPLNSHSNHELGLTQKKAQFIPEALLILDREKNENIKDYTFKGVC